ncbi:MAG: S8 family serine peptidase [Nanoarchaeota archaeon]|nr:S8 family serine peptidase [Nanoarchaeota archaeon]MBU1631607.1 S8 family serine peptidase [Nanoarchaeota archaeon]MBU1875478.1 S8 family serine peptidase [Nanoarchaeota archaeon]
MEYEIYWKRVFVLVGFIIIISALSYVTFFSITNDYLTGYVVMDSQVRIKTEKLDSALIKEIQEGEFKPKVIVILEDNEETISENLVEKNEAIEKNQENVIQDLKDEVEVVEKKEKKEIASSTGILSEEEIDKEVVEQKIPESEEIITEEKKTDFEITKKFETINAFAGEVKDPTALLELTKNKNVKKIILDYPMGVELDESVPHINADDVWGITSGGVNITGVGQTVCVIDTGIDYTHPALGGCNPITYGLLGNIENLSEAVESSHLYENNLDYTWEISKPGYDNIAVHFVNISLEEASGAGDTTDRVYVYDGNNNTLAVYKGSLTDVWSPYAQGNTIYVRLVTDGSVNDYGFYIERVINGTTNTTINWTGCQKVIGGWDTYNNDANPRDDHGHGTHVAGIIASNDIIYRGVAPGASLVAIKALSSAGGGYSSDVLSGIEWCNTNAERLNISAISMSLGCAGVGCVHYQSYCNDDLLSTAVADSNRRNISVFIAAGNSGWTDGISNPACVEYATPVGGVDSNDEMVYNRGQLLKIVMPGTSIYSTYLSGGWASLSGTSMATPHASGSAALLKQYMKAAYGIDATPSQVQNKLILTGKNVDDTSGSGLSFRRGDLFAAIKPILNYTHNIANGSIIQDNYTTINVTSDVPLSSMLLEWTFPNNTKINYTMNDIFFNASSNVSSTEFTILMENLVTGTHYYEAYGVDSLGTTSSTGLRQLIINFGSPEITIFSPLNNHYYNEDFYLNFSVSGSYLTNFSYNLTNPSGEVVIVLTNDSVNSDNTSIINFVDLINFSNSSFVDGNYSLSVSATNNVGSIFEIYNLVIDTTYPLFTSVSKTPENVTENSTVLIKLNITELNINSSAVLIGLNTGGNLSENWTNYSMTLQSTDLFNHTIFNYTLGSESLITNRTIYYSFYAYDLAGNMNSSKVFNFTVNELVAENLTENTSMISSLANITLPINGSVLEVGNNISFIGSSNLSGNKTYLWNFGDGTSADNLSYIKQYNVTGEFVVTFNVSNNESSEISNITIVINDTAAPILKSVNYFEEFHQQRDVNQKVEVDLFDYSSIYSVKLFYENLERNITEVNGSNSDVYIWSFAVGENKSFVIEAVDNSLNKNKINFTYQFSILSCSDNIKNGDETNTDCGGSCSACSSEVVAIQSLEGQEEIKALDTAAVTSSENNVEEKEQSPVSVNWTESPKESRLSRKEKTLYFIGFLSLMLLAIYLVLLKR